MQYCTTQCSLGLHMWRFTMHLKEWKKPCNKEVEFSIKHNSADASSVVLLS